MTAITHLALISGAVIAAVAFAWAVVIYTIRGLKIAWRWAMGNVWGVFTAVVFPAVWLSAYLTQEMGTEVHYIPMADYKSAVDAFTRGEVDLAFLAVSRGCRRGCETPVPRLLRNERATPSFIQYLSFALTYPSIPWKT